MSIHYCEVLAYTILVSPIIHVTVVLLFFSARSNGIVIKGVAAHEVILEVNMIGEVRFLSASNIFMPQYRL